MLENIGLETRILNEIIDFARDCNLDRVILFGSRARGDFRERSDIDLAVAGANAIEFATGIDEKITTLLQFDVVNINSCSQVELLKSIEQEGVCIYEKI